MPIVTLTSDLAGSGYYLAAIKGSILKAFPEVQLVDVSNHIGPLDYKAAAFTIQKAYTYFPEGAIHIVHVNSADGKGRMLIAEKDNHFFLLFDNGTGPLIFEHEPVRFYEVSTEPESGSLFIQTILKGLKMIIERQSFGEAVQQFKVLRRLNPFGNDGTIKGSILFIDPFGNAITNITEEFFNRYITSDYTISAGGASLDRISKHYNVNEPGIAVAFFNSQGLLEIAQNNSRGSQLFGLKVDGPVLIMER